MNFYLSSALILTIAMLCAADDDSIRIAECRSQCLDKFLNINDISFDNNCRNVSSCFMCWESCRLLQENFRVWGPMCANTKICLPGCQQACVFHLITKGRGERAVETKSELDGHFLQPLRAKTVGRDAILLNWTPPQSHKSTSNKILKFVYVISKRTQPDSEWQEIAQTSDLLMVIDDVAPGKKMEFKVTAIINKGIFASTETTYFSHVYPSQDDNNTATNKFVKTWDLNASLKSIKEKNKIEATLSWNPPKQGDFMVVWEVVDNNVDFKGHLYTDTASTTIVLEKNCIYRIHIQMVSTNMKSEVIKVDTNTIDITPLNSSDDSSFKAILLSMSSITLSLLLIIAILLFCWLRALKNSNGCFPITKRNSVTPLEIRNTECGRCSTSTDSTLTPKCKEMMAEKLENFNDFMSEIKRMTPPPYEVRDSNPSTPQVTHNCPSAKRTAENSKNHVFKF